MSAVLPDDRLALVALWSLPLLLPRHPRTMITPTTIMMMKVVLDVYLMLLLFVTHDKKGN